MSNKTSDKNVGSIEDDVRILFNLKLYLESLLASGQDKLFYNDLLYDEKTIDCINAIEDLVKERKKYTIQLTDEQYRKVIENAQMDTSNDTVVAHRFAVMQQQINEKDKQIQELEKENTKYKNSFNQQVEILKDTIKKLNESIPKQAIIDLIENETIDISGFECIAVEDLQELLEGERK